MKYFLLVAILILSYVICIQHNEIQTFNSKIKSLDYRIDNITKKEFTTVQNDSKELFYLTQLSNSTTLILSVIAFALVFAGFSSYHLIKDRFALEKSSIENQITNVITDSERFRVEGNRAQDMLRTEISMKLGEYENSYKELEHIIYDLKNDFDFELVTLKQNEAKEAFSRKDLSSYIFYNLYSANFSTKCVKYYKKQEMNLAETMLTIMTNNLNSMFYDLESFLKFEKAEKHILPLKDKNTIVNLMKNINEIGDSKTFDSLNLIYNLLEFKD